MNNKILIGSIIAVVILILVSFTSAVGFHSVKSTSAINSPLFGIRTRREIGQGQKDITTEYLGHEDEISIHFSGRMAKAEHVQKAIDIIYKMDDKGFNKLVARIINQRQMTDEKTSDVLQTFYYIRENPNNVNYYNMENNPIETLQYITCFEFPGCLIKTIFELLAFIIINIIATFSASACMCQTIYSAGACCYPN